MRQRMPTAVLSVALAGAALALVGCQGAYYRTMEVFGKHKREILVDRVEKARDGQEEAKEQFRTALEAFTDVVEFEGGKLQAKYRQLKRELNTSEKRADAVHKRVDDVADVAEALFAEWEKELEQYESDELRRTSEDQLQDARDRYEQLMAAMRRAEDKMEPVLVAFRDQVLFLKHNLNARAVASLEDTAVTLEQDIAALVADMEASIQEANEFIEAMSTE